jgi:hypothetical protein
MRALVIILTFVFSALEIVTVLLMLPFTLLCSLGLLGFTYKIAWNEKMNQQKRLKGAVKLNGIHKPEWLGA